MATQVNGETPSSAFLSHLYSYPLISDSIATFKTNPYGAKSISLTNSVYEKTGKPLLPYLSGPYEYVSPYVKKVDSIGNNTLSTIDSKFPVVKTPTGELYENGKAFVFFPLTKGLEGKDHVLSTYQTECKKVDGEGFVRYGKAAFSTSLLVASESLEWLSHFFSQKQAEAKEIVKEKTNSS